MTKNNLLIPCLSGIRLADLWWFSGYGHGYMGSWADDPTSKIVCKRSCENTPFTLEWHLKTEMYLQEYDTGDKILLGHCGLGYVCLLANETKVGRQPDANLYITQVPPT